MAAGGGDVGGFGGQLCLEVAGVLADRFAPFLLAALTFGVFEVDGVAGGVVELEGDLGDEAADLGALGGGHAGEVVGGGDEGGHQTALRRWLA